MHRKRFIFSVLFFRNSEAGDPLISLPMTKTALSGMRLITLTLGILLAQTIFSSAAAALSLKLPSHTSEDSGVLSNEGTVLIPRSLASDLVIRLSSSDPNQVSVPESVVIPAGETSVS